MSKILYGNLSTTEVERLLFQKLGLKSCPWHKKILKLNSNKLIIHCP